MVSSRDFFRQPFLTRGFVHPYHLDGSISSFRSFRKIISHIVICIDIPVSIDIRRFLNSVCTVSICLQNGLPI